MLLRHEAIDAVEIVSVQGPVRQNDVDMLRHALLSALAQQPRGILVDLSDAGRLPAAAVAVLDDVRKLAPGWPRPSLVLCCATEAADLVGLGLVVHPARTEGLAHVDDRSAAPRRRFGVDHDLRSPGLARLAMNEAVEALHVEALGDELALVVSELVTNAVRYAQPPVDVELEATAEQVIVGVADSSPGRPLAKADSEDALGGRGLRLVDLLAAETGVRPHAEGKTMWAAFARR